ncbi:MAG: TonB-dependent receptor [Gemmatimonadota bacterium]
MTGALAALELLAGVLAPTSERPRPVQPFAGRLEGRVVVAGTSTAVAGAELTLEGTGLNVRTGADGRFVFDDAPEGRRRLRVEADGYRSSEIVVRIPADRTIRLDIELTAENTTDADDAADRDEPPGEGGESFELPPLRVFGDADVARIRREAPSAWVVDSSVVARVPVAIEVDVFRAVQTLPAVTPSSDYSSAPIVRGGAPSETRLELDGIPLRNPYHLGGFVSAFTPEAASLAVLQPGALPASAPSSLSGRLEIHSRAPNREGPRAAGSIGLLSSRATFDGPIAGGRGGVLVSGRRTYIDIATGGLDALGILNTTIPYAFSDVLTRVDYDLGPGALLSATGYLNRENLDPSDEPFDANWGSDALGLRFRGGVGGRGTIELGAATSGFGGNYLDIDRRPNFGAEASTTISDSSSIRSAERGWVLDATLREHLGDHTVSTGVRWERERFEHEFRPNAQDQEYVPAFVTTRTRQTTALFVEDLWGAGPWQLRLGLRAERPRGRGWQLLPRARVSRRLGAGWSLALGGGSYVQDWIGLRNAEGTIAEVVGYDLLVPVPDDRPLGRGMDAVLEAEGSFAGFGLRGALYRRDLRHVPSPHPSVDPLNEPAAFAPNDIVLGEATVTGFEFSASREYASGSLGLAYRYQDEVRRSLGRTFTPRSERPHRLTLLGTRRWGDRSVSLGVTWMTGSPFTPAEVVLPSVTGVGRDGRTAFGGGSARIVYGAPNSARTRSYLRVDLTARDEWGLHLFGLHGTIEPYLSVLNVLNHHNTLVVEQRTGRFTEGRVEYDPQLPVVPSFGFRWRF